MRGGPLALPDYVEYVPIWGVHASEPEFRGVGTAAATVTGTAAANHAPVVPFSRRLGAPCLVLPASLFRRTRLARTGARGAVWE
jgi:hypothetical protein